MSDRRNALSDYLRALYDIPVLTRAQERELYERRIAGDPFAADELVKHNLRFVVIVAKREPMWMNSSVSMDDLLQFGNEGLMVAAEKWVPKGNIKFASYARRIIERFIRRGVENTDNLIRLPVNIGEEIRHMKYNDRYLSQKLGRDPSSAELAIFIGGSVRRIDYLKTLLLREPISLDALVGKKLIEEDEYE